MKQNYFFVLFFSLFSWIAKSQTCPSNIIVNNDLGVCGAVVNYNSPGGADVLILAADDDPNNITDVQQKLIATGQFSSVGVFDSSVATPTLALLQTYDVVLVWTDALPLNALALGNILTSYIDGGGGVVDACFEIAANSIPGNYNTATYRVLNPAAQTQNVVRTLGTVPLPAHPIMTGVTSFNGGSSSYMSTSTSMAAGSYVVAQYDNAAPLIIARENVGPANARRVSLNFFPPSEDSRADFWDTATDGDLIMANALTWASNNNIISVVQTAGLPRGSIFPIGTTLNTFELTDGLGTVTICNFNVTVIDAELPVITCAANITQNTDPGACGATITGITPLYADNCPAAVLTYAITGATTASGTNSANGLFFNVGTSTVTYTITDPSGNVATCSFTVTVNDVQLPTVITQNITAQLNAAGFATINPTQINNGSSDNCAIGTMGLDVTVFNCTDVGANTVTLTITDINGNVSTGTATVTVVDSILPSVITQPVTILLNPAGTASIIAATIDNGSTDNCGIASMSVNTTTFNCSNVGANTVTLTVTDLSGNTATGTAVVTVQDAIAPVVVTQPVTVQLNAAGTATITPAMINNGSTDNCGIATMSLDVTSFDCTDLGANTVTLTVTDVNGNSTPGIATVTVQDIIAPVAITQPITIQLNAAGNATITPAMVNNGSADNCAIATMALDVTNFNCTDIGPNTVTLTVTDAAGNSASAPVVVTVQDLTPPTVITQNITVQLDAAGNRAITPVMIDNGSNDACGAASLVLNMAAFNCSHVGTNTVALTVTDVNGNVASGTAVVTVQDVTPPVVATQNITVQLDATGNAVLTPAMINNGSSDACGIAFMTLNINTLNCTNVGTNTVTLTVTDVNGNTSTGTANVIVQDTVAPVAVAQNITVSLDPTGNIVIVPAQIDNGSSDACGIAGMSLDITAFNCTDVGPNPVVLTVIDVNGNVSTANAVITIQDTTAPTVITQDIIVPLDATGNMIITEAQIDNGSNDACGIVSMALDIDSFSCSNVGTNIVTLTVTDVNGNVGTGTATVTVLDLILPVVITQNIIVQLDATGNVAIQESDINNGSNEACGIAVMTLDKTNFNCTEVGVNTVTLTVTDANGNISTAPATVTVQDLIMPTVITQDITVQLDGTGNVTITPAQIDNGSYDNCTIASMVLDVTAFDCTNVGVNPVVLTVTDPSGNVTTGTANVTVEDVTPPVILMQDLTIALDAAGNAVITVAHVDTGTTDNCGIASMVLDVTAFDCTDVGANTVTLTVTDVNGNVSTGTSVITIQDVIPPVVLTQDLIVQLDAAGNATITVPQIDNGSNDACGIATMILDITDFDCTDVGNNIVTLIATDVNGNIGINTATVTVQDLIAPSVIVQNITVQLDATGNVVITPAMIDNGSSDACGIASMTLDINAFNCSNIGANTVMLTVTDVNGNVSTATATVTVQDTLPPVVMVQNFTALLDGTGNVVVNVTDVDMGTYDNCGIASLTLSQTHFTCQQVGNHTVIFKAIDVNGLVSTAFVVITVQDEMPPVAIAQNITVQLGPQGTALITPPMINNGSYDNCGIQAMMLDVMSFDCSDVGVNTVMFTVVDIHDNETTVAAQVTVQDAIAPIVNTWPVIVQLGTAGTATITPAQVNHNSTDNCGIANISLDVSTFTCADIGTNIVNLTVTDVNGNSGTATGVVMVEENLAPTVITQPVTVFLDANGEASIVADDVDGGSFDNCGISVKHLDISQFTCDNVGVNEVELTIFDTAGNSASETAQVTVVDNIAPVAVAIAQPLELNLGTDGTVTIEPSQIDAGSTDNCDLTLSLDRDTFGCADIGDNTVTLTVTDPAGNTDSATAIIRILPVPGPTTADTSQTFCFIDSPRVSDIMVNSPSTAVWYSSPTSVIPLDPDAVLHDGTYYAINDFGGCLSDDMLEVTITVKDVAAPTGEQVQYMCSENNNTVANLIMNEQVIWYDTPNGGQPLSSTTQLQNGHFYYASQVGPICEGIQRFKVMVVIHYCDVVVNNAVSANNDGKNDYLAIEGIEYFEDNHIEIFNRWGSKVFETSRYGINGNYFKGYPNTGAGASDTTVLPFGTYYYVLNFVDHDGQSQTKTGYLHLNH